MRELAESHKLRSQQPFSPRKPRYMAMMRQKEVGLQRQIEEERQEEKKREERERWQQEKSRREEREHWQQDKSRWLQDIFGVGRKSYDG